MDENSGYPRDCHDFGNLQFFQPWSPLSQSAANLCTLCCLVSLSKMEALCQSVKCHIFWPEKKSGPLQIKSQNWHKMEVHVATPPKKQPVICQPNPRQQLPTAVSPSHKLSVTRLVLFSFSHHRGTSGKSIGDEEPPVYMYLFHHEAAKNLHNAILNQNQWI